MCIRHIFLDPILRELVLSKVNLPLKYLYS